MDFQNNRCLRQMKQMAQMAQFFFLRNKFFLRKKSQSLIIWWKCLCKALIYSDM